MQVYLVRHAQSANNAQVDGPGERKPDPDLTDLGVRQAAALADYLTNHPEPDQLSDTLAWRYGVFDGLRYRLNRIMTSPMRRALQTTQPLAAQLEIPVKVWPDLCEIGGVYHFRGGRSHGLPGLTRAQIREQFPDYNLPSSVTQHGWWRGDRETRHAAYARAASVAVTLYERCHTDWAGENVLLVAHAGFLNLLVQALLGTLNPDPEAKPGFHAYFYNTSITRIDLDAQRRTILRGLNRLPHLPDEMIS
jgi:broad specificity phosphatase PhoE